MIPNPIYPLTEHEQQAQDFYEYTLQSKSKSTLRSYRFAWAKFSDWCAGSGYDAFNPPHASFEYLLGLFLAAMAKGKELKPASLSAYVAGIRHHYAEKGISIDTHHKKIKEALSGIRRELGTAQVQKKPLSTENIHMIVDAMSDSVPDMRDKAIILLGFSGAFRRSEIVGIDIEHVAFDTGGISILLPYSKTDQEGRGRIVDIPLAKDERYCPVRALVEWISYADIKSGPVFRQLYKGGNILPKRLSAQTVAVIVKTRCEPFGFSSDVSGHSLRSGHVTASIKNGVPESWIMRQTGHASINTLRKYERMKREFVSNSAQGIL